MKGLKFSALLLALCFMFSLAGCDQGAVLTDSNKQLVEPENGVLQEGDSKVKVTVYRGDSTAEWLVAEVSEQILKKGERPENLALNVLLDQPPKSDKLVSVFPSGTKLLGLKVQDGVAEVNLSKQVLAKSIGGSLGELLMTGALVNTLTEFPEIKKVQLLVEGKKVTTISGHMDVLEPLQRNESLIK